MSDRYLISDLHKAARGFRPSSYRMVYYNSLNDEAFDEAWNDLVEELDLEMEREHTGQQIAVRTFEKQIKVLISSGARNRETAVRWLIDSLGLNVYTSDMSYVEWDMSYVECELNLPYGYLNQEK